jgi:hypothetical protein
MADQSLQAFQLGASLFDRAQTQQRMMEQFQQQTAESVLQRQGLELQNKIRDITLADTIEERQAQVDEFKTFSDLSKQVGDYLNNPKPDAKFPVVPAFKSKQFRLEADKMLNNLERYSARAELIASKRRAEAKADALSAAQYNIAAKYGAFKLNPQTGQQDIDYDLVNEIAKKERDAALAQTLAKTSSILGNLEVARGKLQVAANNLERLTKEGASKIELDKARFEFKQALDTEAALLNEKKFEFEKGATTRKLDIEQDKADTAKAKAESGGKLPAPTKLDLDELEFSEAVLNGIKPLEPYLSQDIFGPAFNIKVKAGEVFGGSLPEKTVNQFYENMRTGALFKRGGKALTKTEVDRVTSSIGKPTDVGFSDRIDTFKEITARSIKDRVEKLRMQGITSNPQYGAYVNELERRADEILGIETAPQQQPEIRSFNSIQEAQSANLPVGTRISVGGRPATIK